jgi:hypothetical protein
MLMLSSLFLSCNNKQESKQQFYPISYFIEQEIAVIDSFHLPIKRYYQVVNQSDSSIISITELRSIVNELLLNSLLSDGALNNYEETTINDMNLDFITLSYTTTEKNISKIELHIDPINEKVKSLYAEKTDSQQDSVITKKILWTAGRQLLINTISNVNNRISTTTERYNWSLNYSK